MPTAIDYGALAEQARQGTAAPEPVNPLVPAGIIAGGATAGALGARAIATSPAARRAAIALASHLPGPVGMAAKGAKMVSAMRGAAPAAGGGAASAAPNPAAAAPAPSPAVAATTAVQGPPTTQQAVNLSGMTPDTSAQRLPSTRVVLTEADIAAHPALKAFKPGDDIARTALDRIKLGAQTPTAVRAKAAAPVTDRSLSEATDYWRRRAFASMQEAGMPIGAEDSRAAISKILGRKIASRSELSIEDWTKVEAAAKAAIKPAPKPAASAPPARMATRKITTVRPDGQTVEASAPAPEPGYTGGRGASARTLAMRRAGASKPATSAPAEAGTPLEQQLAAEAAIQDLPMAERAAVRANVMKLIRGGGASTAMGLAAFLPQIGVGLNGFHPDRAAADQEQQGNAVHDLLQRLSIAREHSAALRRALTEGYQQQHTIY